MTMHLLGALSEESNINGNKYNNITTKIGIKNNDFYFSNLFDYDKSFNAF